MGNVVPLEWKRRAVDFHLVPGRGSVLAGPGLFLFAHDARQGVKGETFLDYVGPHRGNEMLSVLDIEEDGTQQFESAKCYSLEV